VKRPDAAVLPWRGKPAEVDARAEADSRTASTFDLQLLAGDRRSGSARPGQRDLADVVARLVIIVLFTFLTRRIGADFLATHDPWGAAVWNIGEVGIPEARAWAILVAAVLVSVFFLAFRSTPWGAAMRASSADPVTAELLGISERRVAAAAWMIGGVLAVLAGIFLAAAPNPGLSSGSHLVALSAIPAVVIGGLDSSEGAVLGGLAVGLVQGLMTGYSSHYPVLGDDVGGVAPYVLMIVVLLWRPSGVFGSKEVARV